MTTDSISSEAQTKMMKSFNIFLGCGLILTSIFMLPEVFDQFGSFVGILEAESFYLMIISIIFFLVGIIFIVLKNFLKAKYAMTAFSFLLVIWIELWFRIFINAFATPQFIHELMEQSNMTYSDQTAYKGSPFMHFTGRSNVELKGSIALTGFAPFNNYGFSGRQMFQYKPRDVIRVACLGESTTADGYPIFLENYLNTNKGQGAKRFEVYNFGHAFWTSAHSVTNFVLNVRDFQPDIVVIHHGWNEEKVRNVPDSVFRNDYSHILKSFESPFVYDRYLLRVSGIYRFIKFKYNKSPEWTNLASSVQDECSHTKITYSNLSELKPFERNLKSIIDLSIIDGIQIVIATLPHTTDSTKALYYAHMNIDQCNNIVRNLHLQYIDNSVLVDLDSLITGKNNAIFTDLAHVNDRGRELKAEAIGRRILELSETNSESRSNWHDKYEIDGRAYFKDFMFQDKGWTKMLQNKADSLGVDLNSVMTSDADFMHSVIDKKEE